MVRARASRRVLAAIPLTLAFAGGGAFVRAQQATFSAGNRTVAVYATVTDTAGRLVPDLARDQFQVDDNGKRQALTVFANEIQPITVVMLLDRSGSMRANFDLVEKAAEQFVEVMLPADKAGIGSFANRIQVDPPDFTSDHATLVKILRTELQPEGPTPLWNAVNVGITDLLHQEGRRVVLVFTDGVDAPMNFSNANSSLKDVMKRAEEENVMVYAIGLAGSGFRGGQGGGYGGRRPGGGFGGGGRRGERRHGPRTPQLPGECAEIVSARGVGDRGSGIGDSLRPLSRCDGTTKTKTHEDHERDSAFESLSQCCRAKRRRTQRTISEAVAMKSASSTIAAAAAAIG